MKPGRHRITARPVSNRSATSAPPHPGGRPPDPPLWDRGAFTRLPQRERLRAENRPTVDAGLHTGVELPASMWQDSTPVQVSLGRCAHRASPGALMTYHTAGRWGVVPAAAVDSARGAFRRSVPGSSGCTASWADPCFGLWCRPEASGCGWPHRLRPSPSLSVRPSLPPNQCPPGPEAAEPRSTHPVWSRSAALARPSWTLSRLSALTTGVTFSG